MLVCVCACVCVCLCRTFVCCVCVCVLACLRKDSYVDVRLDAHRCLETVSSARSRPSVPTCILCVYMYKSMNVTYGIHISKGPPT